MMPVYNAPGNFNAAFRDPRQFGQDESYLQHSYPGGGFSFRKRHGRIDWRKLAIVDVDRVAKDIDVQALQDNIENIAFCDIENELTLKDADGNLVKLLKLAQLLIEYLLHSQEYLQGYIGQMESQIEKAVLEKNNLSAEIEKKNGAYRGLKKEYQKSKTLIAEYQLMLRAGASGIHKCPFCAKSFLSDEFLKAHILRRHAEHSQYTQINGTPIQKGPDARSGQQIIPAGNEELIKELGHITQKLQETEARLVAERDERDRRHEAERETEFKKIQEFSRSELASKDKEIAEMKVLIENHKNMFLEEISTLHSEKNTIQKKLESVTEAQGTKQSMLGNLQDETADSHPEVDIAQIKEQLQKELTASYQEQLDKITKAARRREEQMKKTHTEELEKFASLLTKYDESIKRAEQEKAEMAAKFSKEQEINRNRFERYEHVMDDQQMQLSKMEELLNTKKNRVVSEEETLVEANIPQDAVFASTPMVKRSFEEPKDTQDSDETLILYVASNPLKNYFRLWKTPSPSSSEWKDSFNFKAHKCEKGQFSMPIYVYYASGSPYWRQYVSSSSVPPRPSYKLDYVFYVSTLQLMGTIKLFVLDAGSGDVVRSMISKSEIYPGWKPKGLSFFVLRGPSSQNLMKSVSFQSTLNESEFESGDDVSVSSYAATEDAKKSLAAAIARSREDLLEQEKENEQDIQMKEDKSPPESEVGDDEDVTFDETDGKLDTMASTSQWGSTLLQTGQFLPFPNNPLAVARYNHPKEMIDSCREEALDILSMSLEKRGIDPEATGITNEQFGSKMKLHDNEINTRKMRYPDEPTIRKRIHEDIDRLARDVLGIAEEPKTPEKSRSKFKHAVEKIKNASIFGRTSPRKEKDKGQNLKESSSRPASFINESYEEPPTPKAPKLSKSNQSIEELKPISEPKSILKQERESDTNDEIFDDVSENSQAYSEGSSYGDPSPNAGSAQLPKVTVKKPEDSATKPVEPLTPNISMREPRGEKVRDLAASLEARLFAREGVKKPAGAVDLHDTLQSVPDDQPIQSFKEKYDDDDDDDFDDFDLSDDDDYPEIPSVKKEETGSRQAPSRSSQQPGSSSTSQVKQTVISKFSADDDFDSDSDLGL